MSTSRHRSIRVLLAVVGAVGVATCVDGPTGPGAHTSQPASFNFAPQWESSAHEAVRALADEGLPLDRVRIVIVRPAHDTLKDTTVTMHQGDAPLTLQLDVIAIPNEALDATIQFKSGETILFEGSASVTALPLTTAGNGKAVEIVVVYVGPGAAATKVAVSPATGTYPAMGTVQFSATALANDGTAFPNTPFVWSVSDATLGSITTSGLFTPSGKLGDVVITAATPAKLKGTAAATLVSPVTSIVVVSGDNQTAAVTQPLAQPLVVSVRSSSGAGVPGQTVTFAATDGGAVTSLTAVSDANGLAQTALRVGIRIGAYNFTATSNGFTVGATATATLGTAAKMVLVGPAVFSLTAGLAVTNASTVKILDAGDNPVPNVQASLEVDVANVPAGSLTVTADANGVIALPASFATNATAGVYAVIFSKAGLTGSPITMTVTVVPGAAVKLAMATQPPATPVSGTVWTPQPAVQLQDVAGNAVAQSGVVVTVAVTSGSGTLNGTLTATTSAAGLATFTGLSISGLIGSRTLTFTATGMTSTTATTSIISAAASKLAFKVSPSSTAQNGVAFSVQPTIQLVDASNNPVAQAGVLVTASQTDLGGTMQVATDASGAAAFTNLKLTGSLGAHSVSFSAPGDIASVSASINVTVGSPAFLVVVGSPQTAGAGQPVAIPQGVKVTDIGGNPVQGVAISFTLGANSGSATPLLHVPTDVSGVAHVTTWMLGSVGANTMTASIDVSTTVAPVTITAMGTAGAGVPVRIVPNGAINPTGQVGTALSTPPSVRVVDVNGNGVPGVVIAFAMSGGGTVPQSQVVTDANGVATTSWTLGTFAGLNVLTATAMDTTAAGVGFIGFTGTGTLHTAVFAGNPVVFNATGAAGPAAHMTKLFEASTFYTSTPIFVAVKITDAFGNGVTGVLVTFAVTQGGGSVDSASMLTVFGLASVNWTMGAAPATNQLLATADASGIPENPATFTTDTHVSAPPLARVARITAPLTTLPKKPVTPPR